MAGKNEGVQKVLLETVYIGTGSTDLTTNMVRWLAAQTAPPEKTAQVQALLVLAGVSG